MELSSTQRRGRFQLRDVPHKLLHAHIGCVGTRTLVLCAFALLRGRPDHASVGINEANRHSNAIMFGRPVECMIPPMGAEYRRE